MTEKGERITRFGSNISQLLIQVKLLARLERAIRQTEGREEEDEISTKEELNLAVDFVRRMMCGNQDDH